MVIARYGLFHQGENMTEVVIEPTQREYKLKCKVEIKEITVNDLGKQFTRKCTYLVPDMTDQAMWFFSAWLPDADEEYFELALIIGYPISGPCRGAILRGSKNLQKKHIFVMSKGVSEEFQKLRQDGQNVLVTVLPEGSEAVAEDAQDSDGSYDLLIK